MPFWRAERFRGSVCCERGAAAPPPTYSQADPATGAIIGDTIQEQTRQCLVNFAGMNEEWVRWFPSNPPARQGAKLPARIPDLKVSIAAIAEV